MENRQYEDFYQKSISGESGDRSGQTIKKEKRDYSRAIRSLVSAVAMAIGINIGGGMNTVKKVDENLALKEMSSNFYVECITPKTQETGSRDYHALAEQIEDMDDPNVGYYLFYRNASPEEMDLLFAETEYGTFDHYLEAHQCDDVEEWTESMKDIALLTLEDEEDEMQQVQGETIDTEAEHSYGGTK